MTESAAARHLPYTWDDDRAWPADARWEIVDGDPGEDLPAVREPPARYGAQRV